MLTSDLVRVRRKGNVLHATYLRDAAAKRMLPVVEQYVGVFNTMVGTTRDELDEALNAVEISARDRVAALGLRKVLEDRCTFETTTDVDPEKLRREVFWAAAEVHRGLDVRAEFDREKVLDDAAARLGITKEALEAGLYADLRGSEILKSFDPLDAEEAIDRYNLGLAQAILLRATRVSVRVEGEEPQRYRQLFRAARFHELIHVVRMNPPSEEPPAPLAPPATETPAKKPRKRAAKTSEPPASEPPISEGPKAGYTIDLDGPFSLFDAVQRYGFRLALFLPNVLKCRAFHVHADVLWGRERTHMLFEIRPEDGLVSRAPDPPNNSPEIDAFIEGFRALQSEWLISRNERIFALPGEVVCVPDIVFRSGRTGEEVFLEVFGFWSRAAVWQRVELIRKGFPARILLAVSKHLRVSEEVLDEDAGGELYVYKRTLSPRAILDRLRNDHPRRAGAIP